MRILLLALSLFAFVSTSSAKSPGAPDPALLLGLQSCLNNGVDTGVRAWYSDHPELGAKMAEQVISETAKLGQLIDAEVVSIQPISKRLTRYYVALYFVRSPLWVKIDRYESREKSFFMPLKCSTDPDNILPGYVTEFLATQ